MCDLPAGVCFYFILTLTVLCHVSCQKVKIVATHPEQTEPTDKPVHLTCKLDQLDINTKQYVNKRNTAMLIEVLPNSGKTISLNEDMAGEYTCTANTEPLKTTVIVRMIYPIKWIDAPENQYPLINTDYLVKCQVEGNPVPLVDWLKDGKTITSNDKFVIRPKGLVILNVQEYDDGIYACRAAVISTGELDTRYIRVEVQIPPKIEPITDVEIIEGEQASVECKAFGKPPPNYMWIKKTTKEDLSKIDRFSVNKQTGLLVIHKVQNDDHSVYECVASNNAGRESAFVKFNVLVKVDFKPTIFDFRNITSIVGKEGIIICKGYGNPPPKILIRKFGSRDYFVIGAQPGNNKIVFEQIVDTGQNKSYGILSFNKLNYSDDGTYECIAKNSAGETWQNGHVAVVFPPTCDRSKDQPLFFTGSESSANLSINLHTIKWVNTPENQYPLINTDYLVKCQVESNPGLLIDWLKDGEIITMNEKFVIHPKGLIIRNVQESDDGIYACRVAFVSIGESTRYIRVEVQIPPKIELITDVQITVGEQVSVECKAFGKPPPSYTWIKKATKEDLSKTDRFAVNKETGMLVINRVQNNDHSAYECVASNNAGSETAVFKLNIVAKPRIFEFLNITLSVGKKGIIICKVYGRPPPKVFIRKFGSQYYSVIGAQPGNNEVFFENNVNADKSESYGILTFNKLNRSDDGLYECMAENIAGKSWKNGHVTVEFAPTFEKLKYQAPIFTWGNKSANLSCLAEAIPNATYEWQLNNIEIERKNNFFEIINTGKQSLLIVTPGREKRFYTYYKCIARNIHGTANHYIQLKEFHLPESVQQIKIFHMSPTTILFKITGPEVKENVPIRGYIAQFKEERSLSWTSNKTWSIESPYILENMEPNKTYSIRFAAFNEVGFGPWGGYQKVTMPRKYVPSEPTILNSPEDGIVNLPYTDYFDLRWKIPADNGEPISSYEIKFCPVKRVNDDWVTSPDGCNTKELTGNEHHEVRIDPLDSDTHYMIELRALNVLGYSTPANLIVKTARK